MIPNCRKPFFNFPEELFKKPDFQVGVEPSLHQQLGAPLGYKLSYLFIYLAAGQNVRIRCILAPVKGAKRAFRVTDIRVVHVAINNKSYHIARMETSPYFVGTLPKGEQIGVAQ